MKTLLLLALSLSVTGYVCSQKNTESKCISCKSEKADPKLEADIAIPYKGDFQIRFNKLSVNRKIAFSDGFYEMVESKRDDIEEIQFELSDGILLVIAPKSILNNEGFGPFDEPLIELK